LTLVEPQLNELSNLIDLICQMYLIVLLWKNKLIRSNPGHEYIATKVNDLKK